MRSALIAAAFAAGVLAIPFHERRAEAGSYGPDVDVVYVTAVVTVTADEEAPAYTPEVKHYGHNFPSQPQPPAYTPEPEPTPPEAAPEAPPSYEPPVESTPAPPPAAPGPPKSGGYEDTCLYHHNLHRANHSAPDLTWSDDLKNTAKKIAETCKYEHNVEMDGGGYGQNIAAGVPFDNISAVITDLFYNSEEPLFAAQYGLDDPDMSEFEKWGHFTQIVWEGTTEVGCWTADCSARGLDNTGTGVSPWFTVCNYKSPGNYAGEYGQNVKPPGSMGTASWDAASSAQAPASYKK